MSGIILLLTDQVDSFMAELLKNYFKERGRAIQVAQLHDSGYSLPEKNVVVKHILILAYDKNSLVDRLPLPLPAPASIIFAGGNLTENDIRYWALKGIKGILHNAATLQEVEDCISMQYENKLILSQHLKSVLLDAVLSDRKEVDIKNMTDIEIKILQASKEGYSIKEIAERLQLSPHTIAAYRAKMLKKTGVRSINKLIHILFA